VRVGQRPLGAGQVTGPVPEPLRVHVLGGELKGADGDDPRFFGTATIRSDLKPGRYPVTVVAHHGRVKKTEYVAVTAR
jgi:hypothetical protein